MERLIILLKPISAPAWENKITAKLRQLKPILFLFLTLLLGACVTMKDPESSQENRGDVIASLQPGDLLGQTFHSRRANQDNIQIWLNVDRTRLTPNSRLITRLFRSPDDGEIIQSKAYDLNPLASSSTLSIPLSNPGQHLPAGDYYLEIEVEDGAINVLGRKEDAYAHGSLFLNRLPVDGDLSFRLSYFYGLNSIGEDLASWLTQAWLILPLLAVVWLPGRLLLRLSHLDQNLDWGERSAIAVGLSLSLVPLWMLWTSLINLPWGGISVKIFCLLLALIYIFLLFWPKSTRVSWATAQVSWPMIALGLVFAISLAVRLAMVRDLAGPAWVDSVHHALITRLILTEGGLPDTYAPFLQVSTINYHTGFHSLLAAFIWLTGLQIEQGMLILGQILNALAVLAVYLLAKNFTKSQLAGVFAGLIVGLFTPMPAYYTSWGRYTQLAGLLILPAAWWFIQYLLDSAISSEMPSSGGADTGFRKSLIFILLGGIALAGVMLVHYRVLAFLITLILAYLLVNLSRTAFRPNFKITAWQSLLALAAIGILAALLTLPWWPETLRTFVQPVASVRGTARAFADFSWSYLNTALGKYVLALAGLGLLWSFVQKRWFGLVLVIWVALMFFLANLGVFHLPGANMINNTSVAITLFIPAAILSGYLLGWVVEGWEKLVPAAWKPSYWAVICLVSMTLSFLGALALMPILNPATLLIRQADLPAIGWIKENIPEDETILINPFLWGYGLYAGSDGGYWISPLAERNTMPPAALYNYDFSGDEGRQISADTQKILELAADPGQLHAFLLKKNIRFVYTGVRGGPLSPASLSDSLQFEQIYSKDGVSIFAVLP